jgi:hypothetical protein
MNTETRVMVDDAKICPICGSDCLSLGAFPVSGDYDKPQRWVGEARCGICQTLVVSGAIAHDENDYQKASKRAIHIAYKKWQGRALEKEVCGDAIDYSNEARACRCGSINFRLLRNGIVECSKCTKQDWTRWR